MAEARKHQEHPLVNILINVLIPVLALSHLSKDPELQQALGELDPEQRDALASEPSALRIVAPRPLSETELAETRQAIRAALDIDPPAAVEVDAALIAGLELQGRHGVIHNSLSHDLNRIAEAMIHDDQG